MSTYTPYEDVGVLPPSPVDIEPFIPPDLSATLKNEDPPPRLPTYLGMTRDRITQGANGEYDTLWTTGPTGITVVIPRARELLENPEYYRHDPRFRDLSIFQPPPLPPPFPPLTLNDQLSYNCNDMYTPWLVWDIIHPPQYARLCDRRYFKQWIMPGFDTMAIDPVVDKVWVMSDHPVLAYWMQRWGPISIGSGKMTIKNVLEGIYDYLRTHLTRSDLVHINSIPGNRKALRSARAVRAKESSEVEAVVLKQGYRRVDILGGHRQFQGLRLVIYPDNTWRLHLGLLPGPVSRIF